jgi:hypothetical protein
MDETVYRTHIARLASDEFGGRKPGTEGEKLTLDYLEAEFRKLGLKPGNQRSFARRFPWWRSRRLPMLLSGSLPEKPTPISNSATTW